MKSNYFPQHDAVSAPCHFSIAYSDNETNWVKQVKLLDDVDLIPRRLVGLFLGTG
jgi:hypothetical protein